MSQTQNTFADSFLPEDVFTLISTAANSEQAFYLLQQWSLTVAALQVPAHQVEQQLQAGGFELLRLMLEENFAARGGGDVGTALELEQQDQTLRLGQKRDHTRQYESIFGTVSISRVGFSKRGVPSIHPLDEELNLPKQKYSFVLQQKAVKQCGQGPFGEAVENIQEMTAANVPKRQMQQVVVEAAQDFDAFYEQRQRQVPSPEQTGPILVGGLDCKGVPARRSLEEAKERRGKRMKKGDKRAKKKMATVATVHTTHRFVRTPEQVVSRLMDKHQLKIKQNRPKAEHRRLWASLQKSKDEVIQEATQEMERRDPDREKTVVCVMDGERALKKRAEKYMLSSFPNMILILDIIHVIEYLWKAAYVFFVEGSEQAHNWVRKRLLKILHGGVSRVAAGMRQSASKLGLPEEERKAVDTACDYFLKNKDRMKYNEYLRAGLPIASGSVEGACGHLVKDRMERTGASWNVYESGAEAVLKIRALDKSGDFEDYWQFHVEQEKERNYNRTWNVAL